jgi:hypothetical protein
MTHTINLSPEQVILLKRALYGLKAYSQEELTTLCNKKKKRILRVHKKAQEVINLYKQRKTNFWTNLLFTTLLPNSPITDFFTKNTFTDESFVNKLTFNDLKINNKEIIDLLIRNQVLPTNFYNLQNEIETV